MEVQVLRSMRGQKGIVQLHCVFVRSRAAQRGVRNRYLKSKQTRQDSQHGGDAQQPSNLASLTHGQRRQRDPRSSWSAATEARWPTSSRNR